MHLVPAPAVRLMKSGNQTLEPKKWNGKSMSLRKPTFGSQSYNSKDKNARGLVG